MKGQTSKYFRPRGDWISLKLLKTTIVAGKLPQTQYVNQGTRLFNKTLSVNTEI